MHTWLIIYPSNKFIFQLIYRNLSLSLMYPVQAGLIRSRNGLATHYYENEPKGTVI